MLDNEFQQLFETIEEIQQPSAPALAPSQVPAEAQPNKDTREFIKELDAMLAAREQHGL